MTLCNFRFQECFMEDTWPFIFSVSTEQDFSPKCAAPSLWSGQSSRRVFMDKKEPLAAAQGKW